MSGGWFREPRRHRKAALQGWQNRKQAQQALRSYYLVMAKGRGISAARTATKNARRVLHPRDAESIRRWAESSRRSDIVDVSTARLLASVTGRCRRCTQASRERVAAVARRAREMKMSTRARRDLTPERKRDIENGLDQELARHVRREQKRVRREVERELEEGRLAIRVHARKAWPRERRRRAEAVAQALGIQNLLVADLLIQRAARAGVDFDKVDWDAVQVQGKRSDYTEFVAQLDKQLGKETVTKAEADKLTEVLPGKFVDVENEVERAVDEYREYLEDQARRGLIPEDAIDREVRQFSRQAHGEAAREVAEVQAGTETVARAEREVEAEMDELVDEAEADIMERARQDPRYAADGGTPLPRGMEAQQDLEGRGQLRFTTKAREVPVPLRKGPGPIERLRRARELQRLAEAHQEAVIEGREFPKAQRSLEQVGNTPNDFGFNPEDPLESIAEMPPPGHPENPRWARRKETEDE